MRFGTDKLWSPDNVYRLRIWMWRNNNWRLGIGDKDGDGYKYLGIIERTDTCQEQMERRVKTAILSMCQTGSQVKIKWKKCIPSY